MPSSDARPPAWSTVLRNMPPTGGHSFKAIRRAVQRDRSLSESAIRKALADLCLCGWLKRGGGPRNSAWRLTDRGVRALAKLDQIDQIDSDPRP